METTHVDLVERNARLLEKGRMRLDEAPSPLDRLVDHLTGDEVDQGRDLMANMRWKAAKWLVDSPWLDAFADEVGLDVDEYDDDESLARAIQNRYLIEIGWRDWDLPDGMFEGFREYADGKRWLGRSADSPSWAFMHFDKRVNDARLVHFSDRAADICQGGFEKGVADPTKLGLTGQLHPDERRREGYNFAFRAGDVDQYAQRSRSNEWKYGSSAVVLEADAVIVWHFGDEEPQAIFWGPNAETLDCIYQARNGEWYVDGDRETTFSSPSGAARSI